MSATNFTPIQLYRTTTASATPSAGNLADGELAINLTDEALYFKNAAGVVKLLADSSGALGSVTSVDVSGGTTGLTTSGGPITTSGTITLAGTLGVANGGTGTATAFTAGSVVFAGASGVYTQDNANLFWDNSNDRLGIGTATPAAKLDVRGNIQARTTNDILEAGQLGGVSYIQSYNNASGIAAIPMAFYTGTAERMRITSVGDVAIGTSTAGTKFHVVGGNVWSSNFFEVGRFQKASGTGVTLGYDNSAYVATIGAYSHDGTASNLAFWTYPGSGSATERMRIDSSGNVGIGVTPSPSTTFPALEIGAGNCILGASGFVDYTSNAYYNGSYRYKANGAASYYEQTGGSHLWYNAASGTAGNAISFTERMRIDSSGNLLVGTTTADNRLTVSVSSTGAAAGVLSVVNPNDGAGTAADLDFVTHSSGTLATGRIRGVAVGADDYALAFSSYGPGGIAERMRITGSGDVVIGTTGLAYSFSGRRVLGIDGTDSSLIEMRSGGTQRGYIIGDANTIKVAAAGSNTLQFETNGAERMRIDTSGNVGIGTSSVAGGRVQINGATSDTDGLGLDQGQLLITDSDAAAANGMMLGYRFQAGITEYGRIQCRNAIGATNLILQAAGGNVGIGTSAPQAPFGGRALQVGTTTDARAVFTLQSTTTGRGSVYFSDGTSGGDAFAGYIDYDHSVNAMLFGTGATERARFDNIGNWLVAKTGSADNVLGAELQATGAIVSTRSGSTNAQSTLIVYSTGASAYRFYVGMDGTINATNTSIAAISDIRLKENVRELDAGLDTILALKPRRFDWKEGKGKDVKDDMGFIAQEVEEVLPALIGGWKAGEGEPDDLKSVKAGDLIPVLVKAIQELTARVAQLEGN